jgi:small subunit ribosomal protein S6
LASKVYEGLFLLDSNRYARDAANVAKQINQIVENCGGQMLASRLWSEQKLAYPIEGHRKGVYWLTYFRLDSLRQPELTRACKLNENILRNLILAVDDKLVDALVAHATSVPVSRPAPEGGRESNEVSRTETSHDERFTAKQHQASQHAETTKSE